MDPFIARNHSDPRSGGHVLEHTLLVIGMNIMSETFYPVGIGAQKSGFNAGESSIQTGQILALDTEVDIREQLIRNCGAIYSVVCRRTGVGKARTITSNCTPVPRD